MHELFSTWYRFADPNAPRETIDKRWAATEEILASVTKEEVTELAVYIARTKREAPERLSTTHKKHDEQMPSREIEEELRVLAAVVLRIALERSDNHQVSIVAALSLLTGAFGMKDEPRWLEEHLGAATRCLSEAGRQVRKPGEQVAISSVSPESVNAALTSAQTMIDAVGEANNYLWWAFTKHSRLLDVAYESLPLPVVALVAPADLFGFVRKVPVAPETETLLLHVLLEMPGTRDTELSWKNYFSGLNRDYAQRITKSVPAACSALCPVLWCVAAIADAKTWQNAFEKDFGIRTAAKFPLQSIAIQALRELCLVKALSEKL
jgi:hypothetical protein